MERDFLEQGLERIRLDCVFLQNPEQIRHVFLKALIIQRFLDDKQLVSKNLLEQVVTWLGVGLIAAGLVFNEWIISEFIYKTGSMPPATRLELWVTQIISVSAGFFLLAYRQRRTGFFLGCIKVLSINLAIIVIMAEGFFCEYYLRRIYISERNRCSIGNMI